MSKKRGTCRLCGNTNVKLTADHIQPQCAFNEKNRKHVRLETIQTRAIQKNVPLTSRRSSSIYFDIQPDRPIAGGIYGNTQCASCNGLLGSKYDSRFGQCSHGAVSALKLGEIVVVQQEYRQLCRYPLSFLKRIVAMFFSINGEKFTALHGELAEFVLDVDSNRLPDRYGFYVGYNINDVVSHIPLQVRSNVLTCDTCVVSQISHPPFVYVMTIDSRCPDVRLTNLSPFANFRYDDEANSETVFRLLPTNSCFAGDYRESGKLVQDGVMVFVSEIQPSYFRLIDAII